METSINECEKSVNDVMVSIDGPKKVKCAECQNIWFDFMSGCYWCNAEHSGPYGSTERHLLVFDPDELRVCDKFVKVNVN